MKDCINIIKNLETLFSDNGYDGSGESAFLIESGNVPVMISAPHAINHYRDGKKKWADLYTGGITKYLHKETGCHVIYSCMYTESDPNYNLPGTNKYQDAIIDYLSNHKVFVLIDLHGASKQKEYAVEMGTAPGKDPVTGVCYDEDPSLHSYKFIAEDIKQILEAKFKNLSVEQKSVWKNVIFSAGGQNTVTKYVSENTSTACIQLEVNGHYRNPDNEEAFTALVEGLTEIINHFSNIDLEKMLQ